MESAMHDMQSPAMDSEAGYELKLPSVLDLAGAASFLDTLHQRVAAGGVVRLDASEVSILTLPCIQIILAASRSSASVVIERPSVAFVSAFEDLGLQCPLSQESVVTTGVDESSTPVEQNEDVRSNGDHMAKRILTIDDSKTIRDMLKLTLSDAGFDVLQAVDGQDGVDMLRGERVDIVITDINMPKMDGYAVIRHLRSDPAHKTTPVLVLTTESDTEKKNLAREAGATGWMVKPFDPDRLIATVNKVVP